MKIAFIVRKYQTSGGTERFTFNISKYLAQQGHNITIICNKSRIAPPYSNISLFKIPQFPINRAVKTLLFYLLTKSINLNNYDIVQGAGKVIKQDIYRAGGGFHKLYLRTNNRIPSSLYDRLAINIEKKIYDSKNTKCIISVSNYIAGEIHREFGYPVERIEVFHNPVDLSLFNMDNKDFFQKQFNEKFNINENCIKFLFVANNFKLKGLPLILKTLQSIEKTNYYKLFIVGDNRSNKNDLPESIRKNVFFLGEKFGDELIEIYKSCNVLLHPTSYDPFANVCLEAMACGLPVVTTKVNGASEIMENYQDGIIIEDSNDVKGLENAVRKIISDNNLLKELTDNTLKNIRNYSIEKYADRLIKLYKKVKEEKFYA